MGRLKQNRQPPALTGSSSSSSGRRGKGKGKGKGKGGDGAVAMGQASAKVGILRRIVRTTLKAGLIGVMLVAGATLPKVLEQMRLQSLAAARREAVLRILETDEGGTLDD